MKSASSASGNDIDSERHGIHARGYENEEPKSYVGRLCCTNLHATHAPVASLQSTRNDATCAGRLSIDVVGEKVRSSRAREITPRFRSAVRVRPSLQTIKSELVCSSPIFRNWVMRPWRFSWTSRTKEGVVRDGSYKLNRASSKLWRPSS